MGKITALWALFRQGQSVADPALWKTRQITATVIGGLILAMVNVAASFGYAIPLDMDAANAIGAGLLALVNVLLTVSTTEKVGLPAKPETDSPPLP